MKFSVKQARQYAGYTQIQMAEKLNVSRDIYRSFEKKPEKIPISKAKEIAVITKVPIDRIFFAS